jgi:hypothetical protein
MKWRYAMHLVDIYNTRSAECPISFFIAQSEFVDQCKKVLREFYEGDAQKSESYGRIINERHFQ